MSRVTLEDNDLYDPRLVKGVKFGVHIETKAADWTVDRDQGFLAFITLTGAGRNMTLPAAERGLAFLVQNTSATALDITVKSPAAATLGTISQNEAGLIICDGTTWYVTLVGTST